MRILYVISKKAVVIFSLGFTFAQAANESPQTFTLDGQLYAADHTSPLLDSAVKLKVQILDPSKNCILYEEEQSVDTTASGGHFTIQVGSVVGATKRKSMDAGNTMQKVYQNSSAITATGGSCSGLYSPVLGAIRYVRMIVTPTAGAPTALTPDMVMDAVPNAMVAQSVQGLERENIIQSNPVANVTQSRLEQFFTSLVAGGAGSSIRYDGSNFVAYNPSNGAILSPGTVADSAIGSVGWAKITSVPPALSTIASLNCTNGEILKMVSGVWACASESGVGSESDPTVAAYAKNAPGAGLTVSGGAIVADFGTGAGKVVQGNDSRLSDSRAPNGSAGGDLSGSYPSPTVAKIQGRGVSVTAPVDGQILRYDNGTSTWTPVNFGIDDLKTSIGTSQFVSASCLASQTLIWSAVNDTFSCTDIALPIAQVTGTLPIAQGGTGATSAAAALNALVPSQASNSGKFLTTDGTNASWGTPSMTETDPKVGANTTNYLSKWNGSALVASGVIESGGLVGIGSTSPTTDLDIRNNQNGASGVRVFNNSSAASSKGRLVFDNGTSSGGIGHHGTGFTSAGGYQPNSSYVDSTGANGLSLMATNAAGSVRLYTGGSANANERLRIDSSGNVAIGTTTATAKLDVNGTINASGFTLNGTPLSTGGISSFNGSSQATQTLATPGMSGTAPNWSTNTGTGVHTLNIPMANTTSVTAGLISKTDYDNFNSKIGPSYSLAGDVTGTPAATVVDRIKGIAVSAAPTLAGQVLRYTGSQLAPAFISMADLRSQTTGTNALAASCAASQTLTYNSVGDNLTCSNIAITGGQVSGDIAGNAANVTGIVAITNGGTGATSAAAAAAALLPAQGSNAGKFLTTNGSSLSWATGGGSSGGAPAAWVAFSGIPVTGRSYSRTGTVVTVTSSAHGLLSGMIIEVTSATDTGLNGVGKSITVVDANTYTFTTGSSGTATGTLTQRSVIRGQYNIASITSAAAGSYTVTFATPMPDTNYSVALGTSKSSGGDDGNSTATIGAPVGAGRQPTASSFPISVSVLISGPSLQDSPIVNAIVYHASNPAATVASTGSGTANYIPQWTSSTALGNSPMAVSSGNVGVGTATPAKQLHVMNDLVVDADVASNASMRWYNGGVEKWVMYRPASSTDLRIHEVMVGDAMTFKPGGNVGIGSNTPGTKLDVAGPIRPQGATLGSACSPIGAQAYNSSTGAPIYCNGTIWTAVGSTASLSCTVRSAANSASCTGGETMAGGGCNPAGSGASVNKSYPSASQTWTCTASAGAVTAYAICCTL